MAASPFAIVYFYSMDKESPEKDVSKLIFEFKKYPRANVECILTNDKRTNNVYVLRIFDYSFVYEDDFALLNRKILTETFGLSQYCFGYLNLINKKKIFGHRACVFGNDLFLKIMLDLHNRRSIESHLFIDRELKNKNIGAYFLYYRKWLKIGQND